MNRGKRQLADALDHIRAVRLGIAAMRREIQDINAQLKRMAESLDEPSASQRLPLIELDSPSICPAATP